MKELESLFKYENNIMISGLTSELNIFYIKYLYERFKKNILVVTNSLYEANKINNSLNTYTDKSLIFPMDDFLSSAIVASSPEFKYTRLDTLDKIKNEKYIITTNLMGYLKYLVPLDSKNTYLLKTNQQIKRDELIHYLEELGYKRESIVTATGEYALRGFIVDMFVIGEEKPFRIEFDGNNIESIRYFDHETQLSLQEISEFKLRTVDELKNSEHNSLLDYLDDCIVVFVDKNQLDYSYQKLVNDIFEYQNSVNDKTSIMYEWQELKPKEIVYLESFEKSKDGLVFDSKELINYNQDFEKLKSDYDKWIKKDKKIFFYLNNDKQIKIIRDILPSANIIKQPLNKGFIINDYVFISANDIEQTSKETNNYKKNFYIGKKIKDYNQLEIGDYVVHVSHGIGIYNGLKTLNVKGMKKDFIEILYAGDDKIYVPVEKITTIYKYANKDSERPKINNLNSPAWQKTKKYVEKKVRDISLELIKLYKERISIQKEKYLSYPEEDIFGESFVYELTKDQQKSVYDIDKDLTSKYPMDRLLCGDVGFGKTEVAMRAMFKTVLNNYQVMYLCPTTILSNQQYKVALKRYKDWPITIELINRYTSKKETLRIIEELKNGKIDIIFGTHRLLSNDIELKKLGLLVVDEEQRFGVVHKEKIKNMKKDVNVLTLSATPIPRTLKMAVSGLRDLSIIDTPPVNRFPIQTYVLKEDDLIIKDAIYKELSRNGQIFILYNRVETIEEKTNYIKNLVPDAKVEYAHGKMTKNQLETIMQKFIDHKFDILICTTIIESGIDIANVNTLIVYDADRFGLSQLYQLRGRVGRSDKVAYAYLLYKPDKILTETAIKRLNAIKDFTELGSGYKIAMRDLSIRGAGDIFGASQAGFVDTVGIALYTKMLEDEMRRVKGETVEEDEFISSLLNVSTYIDDNYISDEDIKIEIHQKINEIDSYEKLNQVKSELEDRFGKINEEILIYMYEEWFEKLAAKLDIKKVKQTQRFIEIVLPEHISKNIKGDKLLLEAFSISKNFNLKYENNMIIIVLNIVNLDKHFIFYIVDLLNSLLVV